jgi:shikimate kinase
MIREPCVQAPLLQGGRNIILVGFMATGKTSVGRRLAERSGCSFVDLDDLIEAEAGMPIPRIFEEQGEPAFRALEARMMEQAAGMPRTVIATGGGAVVNPANLRHMQSCGTVIALTADPATILARVGAGPGARRPMLQGDAEARIRCLLAERAPAYGRADVVLDTSQLTVEQVTDAILRLSPPARLGVRGER